MTSIDRAAAGGAAWLCAIVLMLGGSTTASGAFVAAIPQDPPTDPAAVATPDPPTVEARPPTLAERLTEAKARLETVRGGTTPDEAAIRTATALVEVLAATIAAESKAAGLQAELDGAERARETAAGRLETASGREPETTIDVTADLDAVRARVRDFETTRAALDAEASATTAAIERRQARRTAMRTETTTIGEQLSRNEAATDAEIDHRDERIARRRAELRVLDLERRTYDATDDILRDTQRAIARELDVLDRTLAAWRPRLSELEGQAAEAARRAAAVTARTQSDPLAAAVAADNREFADRLAALTTLDDQVSDRLAARTALLDRIRRGLEADRRRFGGQVTPAIATVLRQRDAALPSEATLRQEIADLRTQLPGVELERLLLEDELSRLGNPTAEADRLIAAADPAVPDAEVPTLRRTIVELLDERLETSCQPLMRALNRQADDVSGLLETDLALLDEVGRYRTFVLKQTLWVRDPSALSPELGSQLAREFRVFISTDGWGAIVRSVLVEIQHRPLVGVLAVLPGLLLIGLRRPIDRRITLAGDRVARAATDQFRETIVAAGFALALGLAAACPVWALAIALGDDPLGSRLVLALDHALGRLGVFVLVLGTLAGVVRRGGLAERHFHWSPVMIRTVRRFMVAASIAVLFAVGDRMCDPRELDLPALGRVFYTPIPLIISLFMIDTVRRHDDRGLVDASPGRYRVARTGFARAIVVACVVVPLAAAILANVGWYEATSMLQRATIASLLFLASLLVLREILFRGLHARLRKHSWLLRRQREDGEDVSDEVEALAEIGARTRAAIRFCMVTLVLLGTWLIWRDLLPAFQGLREIVLWTTEASGPVGEDGASGTSIVPISLADLLLAILALIATSYSARHLPTLIEIAVLDWFGLQRGVVYAVTQLVQWTVVIAGLILSFALIGITWASVQWLAAGFTVGLGFGLQEIFANFISGLIILFEQPVRVGDVVTVGGTTGRISRVRMRSTTITDWDRKELVVPNKQFITQEVVNWSIGDSCIRLVLPVGVAYGDDPEKVADILLRVGRADPGTLADPEPHVYFAGFGDSALLFELRVFLPDTDGIIVVRTRLNTAIKRAFDDAGISIPFPQRDVHVQVVPRDDPEGGRAATIPMPSPPPDGTANDHGGSS